MIVDDETILFPQCCSDLSDLSAWKYLLDDNNTFFYSGHPSPRVKKIGEELFFDFLNTETSEQFAPPVSYESITISVKELISVIQVAEKELEIFSKTLEQVNVEYEIGITNISEILIHGKDE